MIIWVEGGSNMGYVKSTTQVNNQRKRVKIVQQQKEIAEDANADAQEALDEVRDARYIQEKKKPAGKVLKAAKKAKGAANKAKKMAGNTKKAAENSDSTDKDEMEDLAEAATVTAEAAEIEAAQADAAEEEATNSAELTPEEVDDMLKKPSSLEERDIWTELKNELGLKTNNDDDMG